MKRPAVKELFIVSQLQEAAKRKAVAGKTGTAFWGEVVVAWYPGCQRFAWFDGRTAITKRTAIKLLEANDIVKQLIREDDT